MSTRTFLCSVLVASCLSPMLAHADDWATIAAPPGEQRIERAVNDGFGGVYFTWVNVPEYAGSILRVNRITNVGVPATGWPAGGRIPTVTDERRAVSEMVADGTGGVFIAWEYLGPAPGGTICDVYLQRLTEDGQIAAGWPDQGILVGHMNYKTNAVTMISDGAGGVFVTWYAKINGVDSDFRTYAQRITGAGTVAAGWPASGVGVSSTENTQLFARACPDGQGGLFVVFAAGPNGGAKDIYAQHLLADGTLAPGWPSTGIPVCTATGDQKPKAYVSWVVPDGAGGFLCTWSDARAENYDVYVQRMTGSGAIASGWPADGLLVGTALGAPVSNNPVIDTDDAGGAIITWEDNPSGANSNVHANRVLANGTVAGGWPAGGVLLSNASGNQSDPRVVRDGSGGAYFVWNDTGKGAAGTRLGPSGVVYTGWSVSGNKIGTGAQGPLSPVLHPSGDLIVGYGNGSYYQAARLHGDGSGYLAPTGVDPSATLSSKIGIAPHPMGDRAEFSISLRGGGPATLELFAIDGRRVWQRDVGSMGAGRHTVPFAASASLAAGIYQLRLTEGATSVSRSVVRIR